MRDPAATSPTRPVLADIVIDEVPRSAGGVGAVTSTMRFVWRDTGIGRGLRALLAVNQADGFDCPGCAWPDPASAGRSRFEFCENGAKAVTEEATVARATPALFAAHSIDELRELTDFQLGQLGRVTEPMVLDADSRHFRPIGWTEAFALIADELRALGPDATALYTSGRTSNEAAFLYQLVGRMFGTNNFPDCSNLCHESSGVALGETIGIGKGTVSLVDFDHADLIFVIGQNPGTNHPRMLTTLREAARRGCTIISINPLREVGLEKFAHPQKLLDVFGGGVGIARETVQVTIGGDLALLLGMGKALLELEAAAPGTVLDQGFIAAKTLGFDAWRRAADAARWDELTVSAGIDEATMRRLGEVYARSERVIACWAMGLTQQPQAVATIQEIVNLMLLRGNLGRPGAGLCPVRGHSNVQGDRTMGITEHPTPGLLDALEREYGFAPPHAPGRDVVETIRGMQAGAIHAMVFLGGNFASATPDTDATITALEHLRLAVSITTKLNRTQAHAGAGPTGRALILPCLGRTEIDRQAGGEQVVTVEDSMSMVHPSRGVLAPASEHLRSEVAIVAGLGEALLGPRAPWPAYTADYGAIRDAIARVIPGFTDFNARIEPRTHPDGFQLPNGGRDGTLSDIGGRAHFTVSPIPDTSLPPGRLRMMTIRSHDQYNTTIYGLDDRYRGIHGERRVIFMSTIDMAALGLAERQWVDLISEWPDRERRCDGFIVVPYAIPRGCAATYFPEANPLVPLGSVAAKSNTPTSKSVIIRVVARTRPWVR